MKNVLFLMVFLVVLVGCKQEKSNVSVDTSQQITDSIFNEPSVYIEEVMIDSTRIKELSPYFTFKKDEFENVTWVEPKDKPKYIDVNDIFCYFMTDGDKASNLRLKIQYAADDWLFIRKYKFSIDGMSFDYAPDDIKRDSEQSIWEWSDNRITAYEQSLIDALVIANNAKIRFVGDKYNKDKNITSKQLLSIKRTVQLYRAMGGAIN